MNQADPQVAYHHMTTQLANRLASLSIIIKNLPHIMEWTAKACFMLCFFLYMMLLIVFGLKAYFFTTEIMDNERMFLANQNKMVLSAPESFYNLWDIVPSEWLYWICFIAKEILWHFAGFTMALMIVSKMPHVRILQLPLLILSVSLIRFSHNYFVVYIALSWILIRFRQYRMFLPPIFHRNAAYAALASHVTSRPLIHSVAA